MIIIFIIIIGTILIFSGLFFSSVSGDDNNENDTGEKYKFTYVAKSEISHNSYTSVIFTSTSDCPISGYYYENSTELKSDFLLLGNSYAEFTCKTNIIIYLTQEPIYTLNNNGTVSLTIVNSNLNDYNYIKINSSKRNQTIYNLVNNSVYVPTNEGYDTGKDISFNFTVTDNETFLMNPGTITITYTLP